MTPYLTALGPPAFSATFPPMVVTAMDPGPGVIQALFGELFLKLHIDHAGLKDRDAVFFIDLEYLIHLGKAEDDPSPGGHGAPGEVGSRAPGRYRYLFPRGHLHDLGDLFGADRQKHGFGHPLNHKGVVRIQEKIFRIVEIPSLAHDRFEFVFNGLSQHRSRSPSSLRSLLPGESPRADSKKLWGYPTKPTSFARIAPRENDPVATLSGDACGGLPSRLQPVQDLFEFFFGEHPF